MPIAAALLPLLLLSAPPVQERPELFRFDGFSDLSSYNPSGKHAPKLETLQTASFTIAIRASFDNPGNAWDSQIGRASLGAVQAGDAIQMSFSARTTGTASIVAVFEQGSAPHEKVIYQTVGTDGTSRDFRITRQTPRAYGAGETQIKFFFVGQGTAEISNISVRNLGAVAGPIGRDDQLGTLKRQRDEGLLKTARANIERLRKGKLSLTVLGGNGKPLANTPVRVKLDRHAFRWGTAVVAELLNADSEIADKYREIVAREFNTVVFENDLKWQNDMTGLDAAVQASEWLRKKRIAIRGHNLVWGAEQYLPDVMKRAKPEEKWPLIERHIRDYTGSMHGRVYVWDVVNEAVTNTRLWEEIGWDKFAESYKLAKAMDPNALVAYNDYNIQNPEHRRGAIALVKRLQAAGAPIEIFGDQAHFGFPELPARAIWDAWDQIAKETGLPIEITEYDFGTFDDAMYADQVEDTMTLAFGHPSVRAFVMWGFWEGAHWRAAEGGAMVKRDFTYRLPMKRFHDLVHREWSTDAMIKTDAKGGLSLPAFYGTYLVSAGQKKAVVEHPKGPSTTARVRLK